MNQKDILKSILLRVDPSLKKRLRIVAKVNGRSVHETAIRMLVNGCNHYIGKISEDDYERLYDETYTPKETKRALEWYSKLKDSSNIDD